MVLVDVRHPAEPQVIAGVIQNDQLVLARRRAQAAPDFLDE
jgi:hypothetical protein